MSIQKVPKNKPTLIKIAIPQNVYITGKGNVVSIKPITMPVATDENGKTITTDCFYCEWINAYGDIAIQQQRDGVQRTARIRMPFNRIIYDALQDKQVKIYLKGIIDAVHCYELASVPDNYAESDKFLEFNVQHYEGK